MFKSKKQTLDFLLEDRIKFATVSGIFTTKPSLIEWVDKNISPLLEVDSDENLLNTFNHHIAQQITFSIENSNVLSKIAFIPKMLITGGGAKNDFLINLLRARLDKKIEIIVPDYQIVDFKEAIIFAFLGLLRSLRQVNTLKSVTGATTDSSGGMIYDHFIQNK